MRVVAALVSSAEVKSEDRPFRWDSGRYNSLPADLAAFVLFFQPAHQWFEVFHHRARGDCLRLSLLSALCANLPRRFLSAAA